LGAWPLGGDVSVPAQSPLSLPTVASCDLVAEEAPCQSTDQESRQRSVCKIETEEHAMKRKDLRRCSGCCDAGGQGRPAEEEATPLLKIVSGTLCQQDVSRFQLVSGFPVILSSSFPPDLGKKTAICLILRPSHPVGHGFVSNSGKDIPELVAYLSSWGHHRLAQRI
jgi:hypothetical protein